MFGKHSFEETLDRETLTLTHAFLWSVPVFQFVVDAHHHHVIPGNLTDARALLSAVIISVSPESRSLGGMSFEPDSFQKILQTRH